MRRWGCLLGGAGLIALIAIAPVQTIIWDGGFADEEYRLTFVRPDGAPVAGVELRVETRAGGVCPIYPVNEFEPDSIPTSDPDGTMVFHHVGRYALEFGGRDHLSLLGIGLWTEGAPQYNCVFLLNGREVHRTRFDSLRLRGNYDQAAKVTRRWKYPDWPVREYLAHVDSWDERRRELFDGNGDGSLDREERTAAHYFERFVEDALEAREKPMMDEIEFAVREQTIIIADP